MLRLSNVIIIGALLITLMSCKKESTNIVLTNNNFINLRSVIDKASIDKALVDLARINKLNPTGEKYIVVESPGGYIAEGYRFIKVASKYKNLHTITIYAASMASAIVQALPGKRYIVPNGLSMFHRGGYVKKVSDLSALELYNSKRIGITVEEYRMKVLREWWIKGEDNLRLNIADKMRTISCDSSLDRAVDNYLVQPNPFLPPQKIVISKCPLVVQPVN